MSFNSFSQFTGWGQELLGWEIHPARSNARWSRLREQQGTEGRADHHRQLGWGRLAVRGPYPAVDDRQEQGYPKVLGRTLRFWEDDCWKTRPFKYYVISTSRSQHLSKQRTKHWILQKCIMFQNDLNYVKRFLLNDESWDLSIPKVRKQCPTETDKVGCQP